MHSNRLPLGHEASAWLPCMHEMSIQPHAGGDIADSLIVALTSRNLVTFYSKTVLYNSAAAL